MAYKRKYAAKKSTKRKYGGRRNSGGGGRTGAKKPRKTYGKKHKGSSRKSFRKKTSRTSSFESKVVRALGVPATFTTENGTRASWNIQTQYSSMARSPPTAFTLYAAEDVFTHIFQLLSAQYAGPNAGFTGFSKGNPMDFYLDECSITARFSNQTAIPCEGVIWHLRPRKALINDLGAVYTATQSTTAPGAAGWSGNGLFGNEKADDTDVGSTPYNFRTILQCFKVLKCYKFKLNAGQMKTMRFKTKRKYHITYKDDGIDALPVTEFFHYNLSSYPVNDSISASTVQYGFGDVDVAWTTTTQYNCRPLPFKYNNVLDNTDTITVPSLLEVNNPTPVTSIPIA